MQKLLNYKYSWALMVVLFIAIVYAVSFVSYRLDLTAEKRFSLNASTKKLLNNVDDVVKVQVFLTGDLPVDYKKLSIATKDFLDELKQVSNNNIQVSFEKPGEDLKEDTAKAMLYDSLARLGVVFERSEVTENKHEKQTNQLIIPSALVSYGGKRPVAVDLRSSKKVYKQFNVVNDIPQEDAEATRNAAEALLEFKFANAIDKLTRTTVPTIAYTIGNGEPIDRTVNDLGESLRTEYKLGVFNLREAYPDPAKIGALLIVKPTNPFSDEDKLKLDQYVMNGGKIIWCIDKLHAELDSLMRSKSEYVAYDRNLNIDDILFRYGVRINGDLVQDLNCSKLPLVIGYNPDKSPRMERVPWPYYPLLASTNNNPIAKNLDKVLPIFPSSIDTVKSPGIAKTILLATDSNSRTLATPALVSANSVKDENDFRSFTKSYIPIAVLLEGKFTSLFANRLTSNVTDSVQKATGKPFAAMCVNDSKQIVMSDADIVTNAITATNGPLAMGELPFENYRFANREFLLNCVDYLVSNNGIFESRNKEFTLRLLDKKKLEAERLTWQLINIAAPIGLVILAGLLLQWARKRKYA
ncbi:gliding motility-associated ABC transporter substrate-binding protein GldG [Parasediminibacterium sp. JCM 36343]|uniref:gliding motility-associated ABC transporter substrate-binding protein GldG n=1 Tax=Parasediminibacterium sp. JCM 36343 TaxID=3374279 RepID=UPI0039793F5C